MKIALTIPGNTQIIPPVEVQHISQNVSGFGGNIFGVAIGVLFIAAASLALGFLAYGGVKWIMSEGDAKAIGEARKTMYYAIIGLSIVFFSFLLVNFLSHFFGVSLLSPS